MWAFDALYVVCEGAVLEAVLITTSVTVVGVRENPLVLKLASGTVMRELGAECSLTHSPKSSSHRQSHSPAGVAQDLENRRLANSV